MNVVYFTVPIVVGTYWIENLSGTAERNLKQAGVLPQPYGTDEEDPGEFSSAPHGKELEKLIEKSIGNGRK